MESVQIQVQIKYLTMIKKIIDTDTDGDKFTIARREKNVKFMKEYGLNHEDIKNIILGLTVNDIGSGPEFDRDSSYSGWIFEFYPLFDETKLYIKIRVENKGKAICISIHEFGLYE